MDLQEIKALSSEKLRLEAFTQKSSLIPAWETLKKHYDAEEHDIVSNQSLRPKDAVDKDMGIRRYARIALPVEKQRTEDLSMFMFSNPVTLEFSDPVAEGDKSQEIMRNIYSKLGFDAANKNRFVGYFGACQMVSVYYLTNQETEGYLPDGELTNSRIRWKHYAPMDVKFSNIQQASIFVTRDNYDDVIAIAIQYSEKVAGKKTQVTEVLTATEYIIYTKTGNGIIEEQIDHTIGKIPAVVWERNTPIYQDVPILRERREFNASFMCDSVEEGADPKVVFSGGLNVDQMAAPTKPKKYIIANEGAGVNQIAPAIDTQSQVLLDDTLTAQIEVNTKQPEFSNKAMRGFGDLSGEALKRALMPTVMKSEYEATYVIEGLRREFNVLKELALLFLPESYKNNFRQLKCTFTIEPFIFDRKSERQQQNRELFKLGALSIVSLLQSEGWSEAEAQKELVRIASEKATDTAFDNEAIGMGEL